LYVINADHTASVSLLMHQLSLSQRVKGEIESAKQITTRLNEQRAKVQAQIDLLKQITKEVWIRDIQ